MLYHFGTRNLSFLKSTTLLDVLTSLAEHETARAACSAAGVAEPELPAYGRALATLAGSRMIVPRDPAAAPDGPGTAGPGNGRSTQRLTGLFELGLTSPICLTWELTYACNLACVH